MPNNPVSSPDTLVSTKPSEEPLPTVMLFSAKLVWLALIAGPPHLSNETSTRVREISAAWFVSIQPLPASLNCELMRLTDALALEEKVIRGSVERERAKTSPSPLKVPELDIETAGEASKMFEPVSSIVESSDWPRMIPAQRSPNPVEVIVA